MQYESEASHVVSLLDDNTVYLGLLQLCKPAEDPLGTQMLHQHLDILCDNIIFRLAHGLHVWHGLSGMFPLDVPL